MAVIQAKVIYNPITIKICPACNQQLLPGQPRLRLYGSAHPEESKYVIFQHPACCRHSTDQKVKSALRGLQ